MAPPPGYFEAQSPTSFVPARNWPGEGDGHWYSRNNRVGGIDGQIGPAWKHFSGTFTAYKPGKFLVHVKRDSEPDNKTPPDTLRTQDVVTALEQWVKRVLPNIDFRIVDMKQLRVYTLQTQDVLEPRGSMLPTWEVTTRQHGHVDNGSIESNNTYKRLFLRNNVIREREGVPVGMKFEFRALSPSFNAYTMKYLTKDDINDPGIWPPFTAYQETSTGHPFLCLPSTDVAHPRGIMPETMMHHHAEGTIGYMEHYLGTKLWGGFEQHQLNCCAEWAFKTREEQKQLWYEKKAPAQDAEWADHVDRNVTGDGPKFSETARAGRGRGSRNG